MRPNLGASAYSTNFRHVASRPITGPVAGEDPHFDEAVLRRQIMVIAAGTLRDGRAVRFCREKGTTFRRYPVIAGKKRKDHRSTP